MWLLCIICTCIISVFATTQYVAYGIIDRPLPACISNADHDDTTYYLTTEWGDIHTDGPDRCLPDSCYWQAGVLHCASLNCVSQKT